MRYIAFAALLLAACSGGGNNPTPPNPPFSGSISPQAAWSITESSAPRPLTNGTFAFQEAHSALQIYDSYVEVPLPVSLNAAQTFTLTFTITGDDPAFVNDTKGNTCAGRQHSRCSCTGPTTRAAPTPAGTAPRCSRCRWRWARTP
jgi:hypothetical protein